MRNLKSGEFDVSFGDAGKLIYSAAGFVKGGLKLLPDGKFLAVGRPSDKRDAVMLVRFLSNGEIDIDFGEQGIIIEVIIEGKSFDSASGCVHGDGRVTVFATEFINDFDTSIWAVRFNSDGSRDIPFGLRKVSNRQANNSIGGICIQADDKVLLTVFEVPSFNVSHPFITRLNVDGSRDTTFGSDGWQYFEDVQFLGKILTQGDGKLVIVGSVGGGVGTGGYVFRQLNNGLPDATFGQGAGRVLIGHRVKGSIQTIGLALDSAASGKIWVVGSIDITAGDSSRGIIARLNKDGELDTSFNEGRLIVHHIGNAGHQNYDIVIDKSGRGIVIGTTIGQADFTVTCWRPNGLKDEDFGSDGCITVDFLLGQDVGTNIELQVDGNIVVSGFSLSDSMKLCGARLFMR